MINQALAARPEVALNTNESDDSASEKGNINVEVGIDSELDGVRCLKSTFW